MIVLDTNVISELMHPRGDAHVLTWVDELQAGDVYLTAVTAAELRYGALRLPDGRRKAELADRIERTLAEDFGGRILSFDDDASTHYADIVVAREHRGLPISMADAQVAAICRCHTARLATRNTKDFAHTGIDLVDPWQVEAQDR
jgi:predicted nucleic acid-binding protein